MYDVIIIGGGPAGVTAALYTARANLKTAILYKNHGALEKAEKVDNFYGNLAITGKRLVARGLKQAKLVGAEVIKKEVVGLTQNDDKTITVQTAKEDYIARTVIIATGASRQTPNIKGLAELEGRGVSYCAICDGFFHKDKDVAVVGSGAYALHEAEDLLPIAKSVTILTNGEEPKVKFPKNVQVKTDKISEVLSQDGFLGKSLRGVMLSGVEAIQLSGLFIALNVAGGTDLVRKIGAVLNSNSVQVDENKRTTVENLWAAGDCTGGVKQIAKAACDGMVAGLDVIKHLKETK